MNCSIPAILLLGTLLTACGSGDDSGGNPSGGAELESVIAEARLTRILQVDAYEWGVASAVFHKPGARAWNGREPAIDSCISAYELDKKRSTTSGAVPGDPVVLEGPAGAITIPGGGDCGYAWCSGGNTSLEASQLSPGDRFDFTTAGSDEMAALDIGAFIEIPSAPAGITREGNLLKWTPGDGDRIEVGLQPGEPNYVICASDDDGELTLPPEVAADAALSVQVFRHFLQVSDVGAGSVVVGIGSNRTDTEF